MASPFINIVPILKDHAPLTAMVGDRMQFAGNAHPRQLPALTVNVYYGKPERVLEGQSTTATETRFLVHSYGATRNDAQAVADAVYSALVGYTDGPYRFKTDALDVTDRGEKGKVYRNRRGYVLHAWG